MLIPRTLQILFPFLTCQVCDGQGFKIVTTYAVHDLATKKRIQWVTDGPPKKAFCERCERSGIIRLRHWFLEKLLFFVTRNDP